MVEVSGFAGTKRSGTAMTTPLLFNTDHVFFGKHKPKDIGKNPFTVQYSAGGIRLKRRNDQQTNGLFIRAQDIKQHLKRMTGASKF